MASNGLEQQQTLNNGSPNEVSPYKRPHSKRSCHEDNTGSPDEESHVGRLNFGSPDKESHVGRLEFGSPAVSPAVSTDESSSGDGEKSTIFVVNPETPPPPVPESKKDGDIELAVPVSDFLRSLCKHKVLSPLQSKKDEFSSPSTLPVGLGSFTTAFQSPDDLDYVVKISTLGTNGENRTGYPLKIDNKSLLSFLNASNKCLGDPNCAKISKMLITQNPNGMWMMWVEQEKCSPLTYDDAKAILECFIALLRKFLPNGVYPKDFKFLNFGKNTSGQVVWFDFDFGKDSRNKPVPSVVSSGDFQFDGNEQFKRMLLALIELFCHPIKSLFNPPLVKDRKDVFRILNEQKGLLQSYSLLSSEKSISETTIKDFAEVLRNIGLSEEDNAYLVGLLTPPASSQ